MSPVSQVNKELEEIFALYQPKPESLIAVLQDIQEEYRYLSEDSLREVAERLNVPLTRVFAVATFYNAFSLEPKGKHVIQICTGTACHLKGAPRLLENVSFLLGVDEGKTTPDGLFSFETVRCLGCCSLAPVITIDGKAYGNLTPDKIKGLIDKHAG